MLLTSKKPGLVARIEACKCQVLGTAVCLLPNLKHRARRAIAAAFDQGLFESFDFYGRKVSRSLALLSISFDAERHQHQLRLHPSIRVPKHWVEGVAPELRVIIECFQDVVRRCGLTIAGSMHLKKNAPTLEIDGELVALPRSTLKTQWVHAASTRLAQLDELEVLYLLSSDLSEKPSASNATRGIQR